MQIYCYRITAVNVGNNSGGTAILVGRSAEANRVHGFAHERPSGLSTISKSAGNIGRVSRTFESSLPGNFRARARRRRDKASEDWPIRAV